MLYDNDERILAMGEKNMLADVIPSSFALAIVVLGIFTGVYLYRSDTVSSLPVRVAEVVIPVLVCLVAAFVIAYRNKNNSYYDVYLTNKSFIVKSSREIKRIQFNEIKYIDKNCIYTRDADYYNKFQNFSKIDMKFREIYPEYNPVIPD